MVLALCRRGLARPVYRRLLDVATSAALALVLSGAPLLKSGPAFASPAPSIEAGSGSSAGSGARSDPVKRAAAKAIEQVIRAQIDAFSRDDGAGAFQFAAKSIQQRFGDPKRFMDMVVSGYPMIYRPASLIFGPLDYQSPTTALQPIGVGDAEGGLWVAIYAMTRQADGQWRIAGVQIRETGGRPV